MLKKGSTFILKLFKNINYNLDQGAPKEGLRCVNLKKKYLNIKSLN